MSEICYECGNYPDETDDLQARVKELEAELASWQEGSKHRPDLQLGEEVRIATIPDDFCYECKSTSCKCEEEQG